MYPAAPDSLSAILLAGVGGGFVLVFLAWLWGLCSWSSRADDVPMVNRKAPGELLLTNAMRRWKADSKKIIEEGFAKVRSDLWILMCPSIAGRRTRLLRNIAR